MVKGVLESYQYTVYDSVYSMRIDLAISCETARSQLVAYY